MTMSVHTNTGAMIALQNLNKTSYEMQDVQNRINTGLKISGAKDNSAIYAVAQGMRHGTRFSAQEQQSPNGRRYVWIKGGDQHVHTAPDTDASVNLDGYISVTPMRADLTAHDALHALKVLE